jgi:hypothetical protein
MRLNEETWIAIFAALAEMDDKFVCLDLSACTRSEESAGGLRADGNFDAKLAESDTVVKLILPDEATGIIGGSTLSRAPFPLLTALEEISGKNVTTVGNYAFAKCGKLKAVSLPAATAFGNSVFQDCPELATLDIPSAESFGATIFQGSGLTALHLPASFTTITVASTTSFTGANNLAAITVHSDNPVFSASGGMLLSKDGATLVAYPGAGGAVTLDAGITEIGQRAFQSAANLTGVIMPGVTDIGIYAFYTCANMETISGPQVKNIADYAFYNCAALTEVSLPLAETLGSNVLRHCTGLTAITLESAKTIGSTTFRESAKLVSISLPSIETIGSWSFADLAAAPLTVTFGSTAPVLLPAGGSVGNRNFANNEVKTVNLRIPQGAAGYDDIWKTSFKGNNATITLNIEEITG